MRHQVVFREGGQRLLSSWWSHIVSWLQHSDGAGAQPKHPVAHPIMVSDDLKSASLYIWNTFVCTFCGEIANCSPPWEFLHSKLSLTHLEGLLSWSSLRKMLLTKSSFDVHLNRHFSNVSWVIFNVCILNWVSKYFEGYSTLICYQCASILSGDNSV